MTFFLRPEASSYGPDAPLPAPEWFLAEVPGTKPLLKALTDAKAEAAAIYTAQSEAIRAFRDVSRTDRDNQYVPLPSLTFDEWRSLKARKEDAEEAARRADRPVKKAWHALRDHVANHPEAQTIAERAARDRHAATLDALEHLEQAIADLGQATPLVPGLLDPKDGFIRRNLAGELTRLAREARHLLAPEKPWTYTNSNSYYEAVKPNPASFRGRAA